MPPQQQKKKKKKKKGVVGIIILVIVLVLLLLALIIGAVAIVIFSGVLKNPKKMFAENVVSITENINGEIPSIGSIPLEALFHLGVDDTQNSHTSIRTTEIMSDAMSQYDLELVQTYSYNKDNGDAAYDFTVNVNGNPTGNGSIYFTDDEFWKDFLSININKNDILRKAIDESQRNITTKNSKSEPNQLPRIKLENNPPKYSHFLLWVS